MGQAKFSISILFWGYFKCLMWGFQFFNSFWANSTTFCKLFTWKIFFCFVKMEQIFLVEIEARPNLKHTEELRLTVLREKEFYMRILIDGWTIFNVSDFLKFIFFEEKKDFFKQLRKEKQNKKVLLNSLNI